MIPLLVALTIPPTELYLRASAVAEALPPPGPWSCEVTARRTYCCRAPAKLVRIYHAGYTCEEKTPAGFVDVSQPTIVERFAADDR